MQTCTLQQNNTQRFQNCQTKQNSIIGLSHLFSIEEFASLFLLSNFPFQENCRQGEEGEGIRKVTFGEEADTSKQPGMFSNNCRIIISAIAGILLKSQDFNFVSVKFLS